MPESGGETTVSEAIDALRARGYDHDFSVEEGALLRCGQCSHLLRAEDAVVDVTYRFEGESDPDDEAVVFGLRCAACEIRGVLVAAYGPTASADDAAVVAALGSA